MAAEFVSLADLLRAAAQPPVPPDAPAAEPVEMLAPIETADLAAPTDDTGAVAALREARLFGARLADAFDAAAARLVRELAAGVLGRELRLAPCEIAAIVRRVLERAPALRVRVAPEDVERLDGIPVLADPALAAGDAIVEVAGGALDARLGVRLAIVLEAFA
ncbi:MAG: hypothetical protein JWO66_2517 [Candidatus Eremiobacteraeota bacterium]|nr:hypothetical protein [Candidatus Eremiobacteraeota bacterium]